MCNESCAEAEREASASEKHLDFAVTISFSYADNTYFVCRTGKGLKFCKLPQQIIICKSTEEADFSPFKISPACPIAVGGNHTVLVVLSASPCLTNLSSRSLPALR